LLQLCSRHIPLNAHLFRLKHVATDKCQACIARQGMPAVEMIPHFLFECPAYSEERHDLDQALGRHSRDLAAMMSNRKGIQEILKYVSRTKRLKETFG
ncbi:hypothetical protein BDZ97DRAFT_1612369, partial [Flammula alnicola]